MITGTLLILLLAILILAFVLFAIFAPIVIHLPQFGKAPAGPRLARMKSSPNFHDGCFHNLGGVEVKLSFHQLMKVVRKMLFGKKKTLVPPHPLKMAHEDLKHLPADKDYYVWFGHSSYLLSLHGTTILVDPTLCVASPFAFVNKAFQGTMAYTPEEMPDSIDVLLITHDHYDHLDYKTFLRLRERVRRVVCPLGVGAHLERWGMESGRISEMDWNDQLSLGEGWGIHCLPAQHFSGRALRRNNTLWASFLLDTPYGRIFAGCDGGYGPHFKEIGTRFPDIRLAILENGQYDEHWSTIHTMPDQLGPEALDLHASKVITVHHSKYALARHAWDEPLDNEVRARDQYGLHLLIAELGAVQELTL